MPAPTPRSNAEWLSALEADAEDAAPALHDLENLVRATLRRLFGGRFSTADFDETTQDALSEILRSRRRFRGDAAFTTWAVSVTTRVGFTELRRRRVREGRTTPFEAIPEGLTPISDAEEAERAPLRDDLMDALHHAIAHALTPRQRSAIMAELHGIPTVEIARQLGTNQNALYKLVHDARKKLRSALAAAGFDRGALAEISGGLR